MLSALQPPPPRSVLAVITIYNGREMTADCLNSLAASTYDRVAPLIIDNASTDGSAEYLASRFPGLKIVRQPGNDGVSRAYNRGIREAWAGGYEYVLIMNNDTVLAPDCLDLLVQRAQAVDAPEILAPLMMYYDRRDSVWFCGGFVDRLRGEAAHCPTLQEFRDRAQTDRFITTCALFMPARVSRRIGLFDERFYMYYDDTDYSVRATAAGCRLDIVEQARLYHRVSASSGGVQDEIGPFHAYHILRSELLFWRKHLGLWRFHRSWCEAHLGNWVNRLPEWWGRADRRASAESIMDAVWYFLASKRTPLTRPASPFWFRHLMCTRPWVVAELMAWRWPGRSR